VTNTAKAYYGDKLSENILETPEGYLICKNVKIARTGWMDYHGQDLPSIFEELPGTPIKVYRSPEEVFSETTLASFEGKPVTNTHPSEMLDINTTPMIERGHAQNVRRDGDYIIADLFIKEAGLISEIQNNLKREVSCGYDCSWHNIGEKKYEQREIIGNHVAVVRNGRAGPRVAIRDEKPKGGIIKNMKITSKFLQALGFQHWAKDAAPEEVEKAMDDLTTEKPDQAISKVADEAHSEINEEKFFKELLSRIEALEGKKSMDKGKAKDELSELEKEMTNGTEDSEEEEEEEEKEKNSAKDEEEEEDRKSAKGAKDEDEYTIKSTADAVLTKFVKDMKPIILEIEDEKTRNKLAKKFIQSVRDARGESFKNNSYADILSTVNNNKRQSAKDSALKNQTMEQGAEMACNAWKAAGEKMNGGLK
jgi:hypothetical protein